MNTKKVYLIYVSIIFVLISSMTCKSKDCSKLSNCNSKIYEVPEKKPLEILSDLNGDGVNERIVFELGWEDERIHSMSILKIKVFNKGKLVYNQNLLSKYGDYHGDYFIQTFRYISSVTKDTYKDFIFIYAGCCPPELYILYCQPRQYTEGHEMIEDEKYNVLDTRIQLEEFQG